MIQQPNGELTANIDDMDKVIIGAWRPVNLMYEHRPEPLVEIFMQHYRKHVRSSPMQARYVDGPALERKAKKMGGKKANGMDLWSIKLLKRLPMQYWDKLAELPRTVERTGTWPERIAEGFTSLVPKGERGGDPMKLRPLTVLSQVYRIWAGLRMEDALAWQEQWAHEESYAFRPREGSMDAAAVLMLLVELSQVLKAPPVGAGTDYTKCFNLIPKAISVAMLNLIGMERGVLNAFHGMYSQLRRKFKIKGCLGA